MEETLRAAGRPSLVARGPQSVATEGSDSLGFTDNG